MLPSTCRRRLCAVIANSRSPASTPARKKLGCDWCGPPNMTVSRGPGSSDGSAFQYSWRQYTVYAAMGREPSARPRRARGSRAPRRTRPAWPTRSAHGIAAPRSRSAPARPSSVHERSSQPSIRRPVRSASVRSQCSKRTERSSASRNSAWASMQPSKRTRSNVVPAKVARSIRQSRNTTSAIDPRVHWTPVSRAPVTVTRRSEHSGATRFARLPRSISTSCSRQPLIVWPLRSASTIRSSSSSSGRGASGARIGSVNYTRRSASRLAFRWKRPPGNGAARTAARLGIPSVFVEVSRCSPPIPR